MEALTQPAPGGDLSYGWIRQWPQCILLLQLTMRCAETGNAAVCHRLLKRLLDCRERMPAAPPVVDSLLRELWYATALATRGDLTAARHHATMASEKTRRIHRLVRETNLMEWRNRCAQLRLESRRLWATTSLLLQRSRELRDRSQAAELRASRCAHRRS